MLASFLPLFLPFFFIGVLLILLRQIRGDDRIRWWICAWLCRAFSLLMLLPVRSAHQLLLVQFLSSLGSLAAVLCCILSLPAARKDTRQIYWAGIGLGVPALAFATFVFFGDGSYWPLYLILTLGFSGGACAAARRFRHEKHRLMLILLLGALSCIPVALAVSHGDRLGALSLIFVQLVFICILMFWWDYPRRSAGLYLTLLGFALWIFSSPASTHFLHWTIFYASIAPGERLVGIGMIMILVQDSLKRAHQAASDLETLLEQSPHMLWLIDPQTLEFHRVNQVAADAHGYSLEEFRKLHWTDIIAREPAPQKLGDSQETPRPTHASLHMRKDGTVFPVDIEARDILIDGKQRRLILGINVTERELLLERFAYNASHDSITGLHSREGFMGREDQLFQQSQRKGKGVAMACLTLRQFKAVNDTYGDHIGDQCLQAIAKRIKDSLRGCDMAARTAGDHFKVLFCDVSDSAEAEVLVQGLLTLLVAPIIIEELSIRIRISIGFAIGPEDGNEMAKLRSRAQTAMWEARKLGVSHALRFHSDHYQGEADDLRIVAAIEEMLEAGTFEVHYQPVCRPTGEIMGLEALLRMPHPTLGSISPAIFIPVAEESGLIIPLGQWVLERVCSQINQWKQQGLPLVPVAVNISGLQFRQSDFSSRIVNTLDSFNIPSRLVHLELTETTVLRNISDALDEMQKLSANGIHFSIDDFGTGYSSLGRLQEMPISMLKLDRSFVRGITPASSMVVAAIISLAHALGMKVIAEGVEEESELQVLRQLDCDMIQGFIFSKPLPPRMLEPLLYHGRCDVPTRMPIWPAEVFRTVRPILSSDRPD
ncbi:PAS domain S-box/diguanylate cyclase (GGDEF) domain-containing protein [Terriglobus roseus DSM 18391]|uniref:PAS domain S-box/diguanylate cyclase (GGDEF) domain-containing protein n=2 Tax=Terriglobus roseus TaxID=392734 RepID=I3ZKH7_TERRK|nr:PAS domain S-box/diguanylate cyclase (GGDEF) domain-containing protein [Terriglobus roseus DSM 18391]